MDRKLLEENEKNVSKLVKQLATIQKKAKVSKKKSFNETVVEEEGIVCSEYLEKVNIKRGRNKKKLQDLGLLHKTPTPKKRKGTDLNSNKGRDTTARKKIIQSPKDKTVNPRRNKKCPYDHKYYSTSYKEENDCRYLGSDYDLFGIKCQECSKIFQKKMKRITV